MTVTEAESQILAPLILRNLENAILNYKFDAGCTDLF